jgi:hypothetical protein
MLISKKNRLAILSYLFKGAPLPCERSSVGPAVWDRRWLQLACGLQLVQRLH